MDPDIPNIDHDEAALSQRAEDSKIGFESQKRKDAEEARKQAVETRKQELHSWRVLLAEAEAEHRILLNHQLKTPATSPTLSSLLPNW
jgi:DNA-binding protein H-NS